MWPKYNHRDWITEGNRCRQTEGCSKGENKRDIENKLIEKLLDSKIPHVFSRMSYTKW